MLKMINLKRFLDVISFSKGLSCNLNWFVNITVFQLTAIQELTCHTVFLATRQRRGDIPVFTPAN